MALWRCSNVLSTTCLSLHPLPARHLESRSVPGSNGARERTRSEGTDRGVKQEPAVSEDCTAPTSVQLWLCKGASQSLPTSCCSLVGGNEAVPGLCSPQMVELCARLLEH